MHSIPPRQTRKRRRRRFTPGTLQHTATLARARAGATSFINDPLLGCDFHPGFINIHLRKIARRPQKSSPLCAPWPCCRATLRPYPGRGCRPCSSSCRTSPCPACRSSPLRVNGPTPVALVRNRVVSARCASRFTRLRQARGAASSRPAGQQWREARARRPLFQRPTFPSRPPSSAHPRLPSWRFLFNWGCVPGLGWAVPHVDGAALTGPKPEATHASARNCDAQAGRAAGTTLRDETSRGDGAGQQALGTSNAYAT